MTASSAFTESKWEFSVTLPGGSILDAYLEPDPYAQHNIVMTIWVMNLDGSDYIRYGNFATIVSDAVVDNPGTDMMIKPDVPQGIVQSVIDSGLIEDMPYTKILDRHVRRDVYEMTDAGKEWFNKYMSAGFSDTSYLYDNMR